MTNIELLGIVESIFETIYVAMGDCAIHESVISASSNFGSVHDQRSSSPIEASMPTTDAHQAALVELYAAILVLAVKAKEYVTMAGGSGMLLSFFLVVAPWLWSQSRRLYCSGVVQY